MICVCVCVLNYCYIADMVRHASFYSNNSNSMTMSLCSVSWIVLLIFMTHKIGHDVKINIVILIATYYYTVEPLNKGHIGDNINSLVLSFVERLSSSRRL